LIQKSKRKEYEKKYKNIKKYIEIEDGMYKYKKGDEKRLKGKFDRVYILSSRQLFFNMNEFYKLLKKAKLSKKLYGFNKYGDEWNLKTSIKRKFLSNEFLFSVYFVINFKYLSNKVIE
jgi:hypothetical protein